MAEVEVNHRGKQCCPRRQEAFQRPVPEGELPDRWVRRVNQGGLGDGEITCNYCGSLHPDEFMEYVRKGYIVGPTDKNYKAYVEAPSTEEEKKQRRDSWFAGDLGKIFVRQHGLEKAEEYYDNEVDIAGGGKAVGKFYYQHLSEAQRKEFCDLYNDGTMQVGYPGHFYRLPFFVKK